MTQTTPIAAAPRADSPSHPGRSRVGRALTWVLAVIVALALGLSAVLAWSFVRPFPQTRGEIPAAGLEAAVLVQRDAQGVPTITAETSHDLFFAQGFTHAGDRFWEMDFRRHLTSARLSELFGESQVDTDKFLRTLGWRQVAEAEVAALPPETLAFYQAYADGVNAYLAERSGGGLSLEYTVLGLQNPEYEPEPWTPADSVAWFKAMAWDLRTNIEDETDRAILAQSLPLEQLEELYPEYPFDEHPVVVDRDWNGDGMSANRDVEGTTTADTVAFPSAVAPETSAAATDYPADPADPADPAVSESLSRLLATGEGVGSNSWVVSGEHTASGMPLLADDPHLGAELPSVWNQQQLRCAPVSDACPFDVAGFSFSGVPGIAIGHNQDIAWGFTNLSTDVADLYVERIDGDTSWRDGERVPIESREETLTVAGSDDVTFEVRETVHGPIVSGLTPDFTSIAEDPPVDAGALPGEHALSLRWTALEPGRTAEAIFSLNLASDFDEFRVAASQFDVPAQSLIYADTSGNIGYQAPGKLPIRGEGDGWLPQPGWDSAYDWQGYIPFADLPTDLNPESGVIVTANHAIASDDYPYFLTRDWNSGFRGDRITELLEERIAAGPVTADDMREIQMDNRFPVAPALQEAIGDLDATEVRRTADADAGTVDAALALLDDWNGQNDADSAAAAYANVLWERVTALLLSGDTTIPRGDQSLLFLMFEKQLADPESTWWRDEDSGTTGRDAVLAVAAGQAVDELVVLQGDDPAQWDWGDLHAITLTHGTFGTSGIGLVEGLFNRGPIPVGGGDGVVNATGWSLGDGYATQTVPSFRTVMDPGDWDSSTWHHLTGASGHAFHPHYTDQAEDWAAGRQYPWAYSPDAVNTAAHDALRLVPARE